MAPALVLIIMLVLGIALAGAVAVAALELREVAIMREDLRKALARAKLAERALSDLRIKRSRAVSQGNRTRAAVQAARRDVTTDQIRRDAASSNHRRKGPCPRSGKTTGSSMNGPRSPECAEAVRRWMLAQISERANVFYQGPMPAAGGGDAGHHFSISVPVADADSLLGLRSLSGPVLSPCVDVSVVLVVPSPRIETRGRWSRREVTVHVKGNA
jgi:hypothetical protein